jgi:hypothetical protein
MHTQKKINTKVKQRSRRERTNMGGEQSLPHFFTHPTRIATPGEFSTSYTTPLPQPLDIFIGTLRNEDKDHIRSLMKPLYDNLCKKEVKSENRGTMKDTYSLTVSDDSSPG